MNSSNDFPLVGPHSLIHSFIHSFSILCLRGRVRNGATALIIPLNDNCDYKLVDRLIENEVDFTAMTLERQRDFHPPSGVEVELSESFSA